MGISNFRRVACLGMATFCLFVSFASANDLKLAPPSFTVEGKKVVPIDFINQKLSIVFDVAEKRAKAVAVVDFVTAESGSPMLDMRATPESVILDGRYLPAESFKTIDSPDKETQFVMLDKDVSPHVRHRMEVRYDVLAEHVTFTEDGASIGFFMSDVGSDRDFLEQYAPANFEFDAFPMQVTLRVDGTGTHQLFTNGKVFSKKSNEWEVRFPSYYITSSFYLHLTQKPMIVAQEDYQGLKKVIPITVYSEKETLTTDAMKKAKEVIAELEGDYGAFAHDKVVIYVTSGGGGMEYCGATMTSMGALGHELTHSYFARGVMPANGNAGWIDEAIASWRDDDYPVATAAPARPPVNLGGFSPYRRTTPYEAYEEGATLMSEFDFLFKEKREGLKPVLQSLFSANQHKVITTPFLGQFLQSVTGMDLTKIFTKYVYGKGEEDEGNHLNFIPTIPRTKPMPHHPRKYTKTELAEYR